jgi:hypothetical protein
LSSSRLGMPERAIVDLFRLLHRFALAGDF